MAETHRELGRREIVGKAQAEMFVLRASAGTLQHRVVSFRFPCSAFCFCQARCIQLLSWRVALVLGLFTISEEHDTR